MSIMILTLLFFLLSTLKYVAIGDNKRVGSFLAVVNLYSLVNWEAFNELLSGYRSICEGGWDVKLVFLASFHWDDNFIRWCDRNLHCQRIQKSLEVEVRVFNKSVGTRIVDYSREPMEQYISQFDIFMYAEDDMILTWDKFSAWVEESKMLKSLHGANDKNVWNKNIVCSYRYPCYFNIGFLRSRKNPHTRVRDMHRDHVDQWHMNRIVENSRLDEQPKFEPTCIGSRPYISLNQSPHQAMWILTREDILALNSSCSFLRQHYSKTWKAQGFVREYMGSMSLFRNPHRSFPPLNCMVSKVIPADRLETFKIEHYKRSGIKSNGDEKTSVFTADELTRQGIDYTAPKKPLSDPLPPCWKMLKAESSVSSSVKILSFENMEVGENIIDLQQHE